MDAYGALKSGLPSLLGYLLLATMLLERVRSGSRFNILLLQHDAHRKCALIMRPS